MRAHLLLHLRAIRAKYWFLPTIMALGAIVLAFLAVALDRRLGADWIERIPWLFANEPDGARSLLSTIAASMITVAGVTFSVTTAALATTASTFGPRLIGNFMQDRGSQITLGTFVATFLYCLLVLRSIQTGHANEAPFVPNTAVMLGLLLAVASLSLLIYFIHHIPESIHISNIVAQLGQELHAQVEAMFPSQVGTSAGSDEPPEHGGPAAASTTTRELRARKVGYVQYIDVDGLMRRAKAHDLVVDLQRRPGDFAPIGCVLATVGRESAIDDEICQALLSTIAIGGYQSQEQDILYLVNRLVELTARALSPGMNDIFTATNAIDWLGGGLALLAQREIPDDARCDDEGRLRVVARSRTFEEIAAAIFDQLRPYAASDRNAAVHLLGVLADVAGEVTSDERRAVLRAHAEELHRAARDAHALPRDLEAIETASEDAIRASSPPAAAAPEPARAPARGSAPLARP